ncbi:MAG: hypothetical protein FP816_04545 [Desulfobacteraceae bacterium]|nr:hypothetical protein [Desulfobacteraceae bacterium]
MIPLNIQDTNDEIFARIAKAVSKKYGCTLEIDFQNGNHMVKFIGDEHYKPCIAEELSHIFGVKLPAAMQGIT